VLFSADPDDLTIPASTTKLVTAATVLAARGPAYRLITRVVAGAKPGEVVIIGGGDPTLATRSNSLFPGAARLDKLAAQVKKALGGVKPTRVVVDGTLFSGPTLGPGWDSGLVSPEGQVARITALSINAGRIEPVHHLRGADPRFTDPSDAAGKAFAKALGVPDAPVTSGKAPAAATAPSTDATGAIAPGTELGSVESPPLVRIVDWMLQLSDNVLAEALARQVALAAGEPASFEGAAAAMEAAVIDLGLPAEESNLFDGSGLSRKNEVTPSMLTDLLKLAALGTKPELTAMFGGLPVAGWSGTLQERFVTQKGNRAGLGLVRAKTGSLSGVSALSGELVTRDGRLLVFAIMADGVPNTGQDAARAALDRIATRLVSCGCP
jgi:D-alanyl-D-alanine carboxypeptidase/D-alanyl-D-alanine-endopeptidase (penicillin-binding protein 4)